MSLKSRIMRRCFDLARLGKGLASPNPIVGAVLVHEDRIIGEGYYAEDGGPHAEVVTVRSVRPADEHLIQESTLYVSLEPCNIWGRTPPCTNLILDQRIPHVVVAARDLTPGVDGSGLERLRAAGVKVEEAVLPEIGARLSRYRNIYVSEQRPYVVLKYAQTENGFIAPADETQFWLTNAISKRLVHKWRTETDAILIGAGTARTDNPALTSRLVPGKQPQRLVIDRAGKLPSDLQLFDGAHPTLVITQKPGEERDQLEFMELDFTNEDWPKQLLKQLADRKIAHLTIEGGAWLLHTFVKGELWDEARVFCSRHNWSDGKAAPNLGTEAQETFKIAEDTLKVYYRP
ncbi:MAG: bifunctional diaminohydroxyphosphoribosylaminopyrimidine deaminase/5-amino-6-(5-phosphoribosylamino)uracil reductase RibD [Bacteroidota bacterium]